MIVRVPSVKRLGGAINTTFSAFDQSTYEFYLSPRPRCASACGMILAGGKVRLVDETRSVGVHSLRLNVDAAPARYGESQDVVVGDSALIGAEWANYMRDMGISQKFISTALGVHPDCMYYLSANEMVSWAVINLPERQPADSSIVGRLEPPDTGKCRLLP